MSSLCEIFEISLKLQGPKPRSRMLGRVTVPRLAGDIIGRGKKTIALKASDNFIESRQLGQHGEL